MSILSDFEDRVGGAVEAMFAGVFRAPVQPAELARACGKEMDKRRKLGVGKVYAPTLYSVLLSPADGEQLGGFARTLAGELETYLHGYAREKGYELATRPRVRFLIDDELKLGRFTVIGELLSAEEIVAELGDDDVYYDPDSAQPEPPLRREVTHAQPVGGAIEPHLTVQSTGEKVWLGDERLVIGRLKTCDVHIEDKNASREHAAIERDGGGWALVDLGSTNGTYVNGQRIDRIRLRPGDAITIGVTELAFHDAGRVR